MKYIRVDTGEEVSPEDVIDLKLIPIPISMVFDDGEVDDRQEAADKTHPGFTITCQKCGSTVVIVDNSQGYSPTSGAWGSVDLVCQDCDERVKLTSSY